MKIIEYKGKKYETTYDFPILDKEKLKYLETEYEENIITELIKKVESLQKQLQQKENIIKEVREYIKEQLSQGGERELRDLVDGYELLEILDKESSNGSN